MADYQVRHLVSLSSHLVSGHPQPIPPELGLYGSSQEIEHLGNKGLQTDQPHSLLQQIVCQAAVIKASTAHAPSSDAQIERFHL
jgi:hypothetical protein